MYLVGEVANKDVIIVDDMIDTAGTLAHAVKELKGRGAKKVFAFATHGYFLNYLFIKYLLFLLFIKDCFLEMLLRI